MPPSSIREPASFLRVVVDRAGQPDALVAAAPIVELRFRPGSKSLSLRAGKLFHLLVRQGGERLTEATTHSVRLADLSTAVGNMTAADVIEALRELQQTLVEVTLSQPGEAGKPRLTVHTGQMLADTGRDVDATGILSFRFSDTMRWVFGNSRHWALLSRRCVLAFESKYALRAYEIIALRAGLGRATSEVFTLDDIRRRLGVPDGKLKTWQDIRRRVLEFACAEVSHISDFTVSFTPIKTGHSVTSVRLSWRQKDADGRAAAAAELERHRVGRRARRNGTVETVALPAGQGDDQPSQQPATPAAEKDAKPHLPLGPFPMSGTISYSRWGELVRQHAPAPTPDVDRVANAFRDWASHAGLPLGGATVEKAFTTFCRNFRSRRQ